MVLQLTPRGRAAVVVEVQIEASMRAAADDATAVWRLERMLWLNSAPVCVPRETPLRFQNSMGKPLACPPVVSSFERALGSRSLFPKKGRALGLFQKDRKSTKVSLSLSLSFPCELWTGDIGQDASQVTQPYAPLEALDRLAAQGSLELRCLGRSLAIDATTGLPSALVSNGRQVLAEPARFTFGGTAFAAVDSSFAWGLGAGNASATWTHTRVAADGKGAPVHKLIVGRFIGVRWDSLSRYRSESPSREAPSVLPLPRRRERRDDRHARSQPIRRVP